MRAFTIVLLASISLGGTANAWFWGGNDDLDFSSAETMQQSVEDVTKDMSPADRKAFGQALLAILMEKNPVTGAAEPGLGQLMAMGQLGDTFYDGMDVWMDGISVETVKARATLIATRRSAQADAAEKAEYDKERQKIALEAQQQCLDQRIAISSVRLEEGDYGDHLSFDVTNDLPFAISGFQFEYVVKQEGRSVPINKDASSFSVSGGIEPGETRSLSYSYFGPTGEFGNTFVETRMINAFDAGELPLLDTNTMYLGRPEGFSEHKCA